MGVCSCPVRKDCKHVAALLFAAEDHPAVRAQLLSAPAFGQTAQPGAIVQRPAWEQALSKLIATPGTTPQGQGLPLALAFEVEEPAPHFSYTGRRDPLRSVRQLKARPVMMGAKGKWIRGDVSWTNLNYLGYKREFNEAHIDWMQNFLAAHSTADYRQLTSSMWMLLNEFAGKNLWSLLAEADEDRGFAHPLRRERAGPHCRGARRRRA